MSLDRTHRDIHGFRKRSRIGRGPGSGHGKTSGRGHKGQQSRAGFSRSPIFEGGMMPLVRRIPKRGFHNPFAPTVAIVNVGDLDRLFAAGDEVNPESLRRVSLTKGRHEVVKILGSGALSKKLRISAHRFSKSAVEKIEAAGGQVTRLKEKVTVQEKQGQAQSS